MVSPVLYEDFKTAEFLVTEMPGTLSRDVVLFDNTAGALDLKIQAGTVYSYEGYGNPVVTTGTNVGNGTLTGAAPQPAQNGLRAALLGNYLITFTSPTAFTVTAPDGLVLPAGTVGVAYVNEILFKLTAGGTPFAANDTFTIAIQPGMGYAVTAANAGNTGNGTVGAVTLAQPAGGNPGALMGAYQVAFTSATAYTVTAPDGRQLANGKTGTAYSDEIGFTITAGGTPFAVGDGFAIQVNDPPSPANGAVTLFTGAAPAAGIIYNFAFIPALGTRRVAAITRNAEVNLSYLQWAPGVTAAQQATALAQLAQLGIIARP
jgi:hypothetical protein